MNKSIEIGGHVIGMDSPTFVIAEMSANHLMDYDDMLVFTYDMFRH